jgi:hypothetical protein
MERISFMILAAFVLIADPVAVDDTSSRKPNHYPKLRTTELAQESNEIAVIAAETFQVRQVN